MSSGAEISGVPQLSRRLTAITETQKILRRLQIDTTAEAKRLVPRKTGNLGRSISPGFLSKTEAIVAAHARYAAYVEFGTRPHVIRPKKGKALRWPTSPTLGGRARAGSGYAFARVVHHPGTKPHPFLVPGAKKAAGGRGLPDTVVQLWNDAA